MRQSSAPDTQAAIELYRLSPYRVAPGLLRSVALVKEAAAQCNGELGYLDSGTTEVLVASCRRLRALSDPELGGELPLDAFQGGAGTSVNMAVNEWIARDASESGVAIDPHGQVNLHQSTNDVMPTALRLMMHDLLVELEEATEALQGELQEAETRYDGLLKTARTQLRDAVVTSLGREFGTWAHAVARDRWRCFKARERIREVNLGGTAIGSGTGAPRRYVLGVVRHLQELVEHPISRAEHLIEATSNYDQIVEAMEAPRCLAVNLRRVASDLRLLASGPASAVGELRLPQLVRGSSIMAGKVNPVVLEAVIQCAERILANDGLIARLAAMSELELNAFFPAIAHSVHESLSLALGATRALSGYLPLLEPDEQRCALGLARSYAEVVALLPLVTYTECETLLATAKARGLSLRRYLEDNGLISETDGQAIFAPKNLTALGYDEALYRDIRERWASKIRAHIDQISDGKEK